MRVVNITLAVLMFGVFLAVFILAWRRKWPAWSATWYPIFVGTPLVLAGALLSWLAQERLNYVINQVTVLFFLFPLIVAVLLYTVTRSSPRRGLLAALFLLYLLWQLNMEFVPDLIEVAIKVPSIALTCLVIVFVLRRGNWQAGLYAILALNLVVGALFSYGGIYHGGTLPGTAPGPNLVEVMRNLIPQYLAMGAILIGPLFARKIRLAGRSGGPSGRAGYHLVLAGLLLVILANIAGLGLSLDTRTESHTAAIHAAQLAGIVLGLAVYLLGLVLLYRATPFARTAPGWAERLLLPLLPLAIPVTFVMPFITWKWPVSDLYGVPLLWVLPHAVSLALGLGWLALSVWVVTQPSEAPAPAAPGLPEAAA